MSGGGGNTGLCYPTMLTQNYAYTTHQKEQQQESTDIARPRALSIRSMSKVMQVNKDQRISKARVKSACLCSFVLL